MHRQKALLNAWAHYVVRRGGSKQRKRQTDTQTHRQTELGRRSTRSSLAFTAFLRKKSATRLKAASPSHE